MKLQSLSVCAVVCLLGSSTVAGQDVKVSRENKIISVTATATVSAESDVALVQVGYHNYGPTKDAAFMENVRFASQILQALKNAGVPDAVIQTKNISLERASDVPEELRKQQQYEATQRWVIRVRPQDAQGVVDLAVEAGANDVGEVVWTLADLPALEARAHVAAVARARALAQQMSTEQGIQIGTLLYLSNVEAARPESIGLTEKAQFIERFWMRRNVNLKLFPQKVERSATVYATFAIQ